MPEAQRPLRDSGARRPPTQGPRGRLLDLQLCLGLRALYFLPRFLYCFVKQESVQRFLNVGNYPILSEIPLPALDWELLQGGTVLAVFGFLEPP